MCKKQISGVMSEVSLLTLEAYVFVCPQTVSIAHVAAAVADNVMIAIHYGSQKASVGS